MKKFLVFTFTAIMLLAILSGCSDRNNVSDNKDGSINATETNNIVDDVTDMFSEEPTTERKTTAEPTTEHNSTESVGGETETAEDSTEGAQDNARARRTMPRR
ncbi:MAG: hypothetical protein E7434_02095 [Ruminococcaceae bacterium]|nr:hypothetical protein [Oscillospiraceae bacterium]